MEIIWRVISREGEEGEWGEGTGIKKHKWQVQNRQGEVKNRIENGEAKELMCVTPGHELRGQAWRGGLQGEGEGGEWRKGTGNKKHKWQVQNRQGEIKNSTGNGEAKELMCTTDGHN